MSWGTLGLGLRGAVLGFSIAAPVGPIGLLCIRRTVQAGRGVGLATGLGAATADAMYGLVAGLGLTAVSRFLVAQQAWMRLGGGLALLAMGVHALRSRPAEHAAAAREGGGLLSAWGSTLALTLSNPMTILSFVAAFVALGLPPNAGPAGAAALVLGVFCGSAAWWLLLSGAVGRVRSRLEPAHLRWLHVVSGLLLVGFGAWSVAAAIAA